VNKSKIVIAGLTAIIVPFLMACPKDAAKPKQDPMDGDPEGVRDLLLQTWVSERCSPYSIHLTSSGKGLIPESDIHIAGGGWEHALTYSAGKRIQFTIKVTAKDGCAEGWCKIDDGRFGDAQDNLNQYGKAACVYTTKG